MRSLFTALLAVSAWALAACSPAPAPQGEPALWRIADADSEIWLFGTVHMLPPDLRWRGERVNAAFASADEFMTETDTSADANSAFPTLAARYGLLPPNQNLSALLPPADRASLAETVRELGLDAAQIERMRPWFAALQLSYAYAMREGHSVDAGVETVLAAAARRSGKRLSFFETPEEQIRILADLPPADQAHFLAVTLRQIADKDGALAESDEAWARGDIEALDTALAPQWEEAGPVLHEAVILRRNRAWADEVATRLDGSGRIFIAVGAAHLVGDDSVVDLLRARGIEVEGP
ncbi:MAG: TraB/GumN family protein [Hyphomonadaceae bacterium JAD_PAG50586_4]|nr:MAG: TraB/GumN family protein [Hyphomonadaceae bacterium JAD_PAG50586_4]